MTAITELVTAVEARISSGTLLQLTEWDNPDATTVNSSRLTAAATDAITKFTARKITYDQNQAEHVAIGVMLTRCLLQKNQGGVTPQQVQDDYKECLESLDHIREGMAMKGGSKRGWSSYTSRADDAGSRFPRSVMDKVRQPPKNPRNY